MKRTRNCMSYKIKMWYYRLTFGDIKNILKKVSSFVFEFIIAFLGFILFFVFPALFH